jgi:hypothetical protein
LAGAPATSSYLLGLELVDRWRLCPHVPPDSPVHTGQSGVPLILCSDFCRVYCFTLFTVRVDRWREVAISPLAHRTVRWILAERPPVFPKLASSEPLLSEAPDIVRWCTGHCPVPHFGFFLLLRFEPCLVLSIGFCWIFDTCGTCNLEQTS